MGLTNNQLCLIRAVAENKIQDAKKAAICCCEEDKTQKIKNKWLDIKIC